MTERLHISPFSSDLLNVIIPPSILPAATNISFHTLETFPERNYGYVDLPKMEAEKVKKKFSGTILKGSKVKIEAARPSRKHPRQEDEENASDASEPHKKAKKVKKSKTKEEIYAIPGYELPETRKVQRGWTDAESKKKEKGIREKKSKKKPSSITDKPECLFRTKVPPNVAAITTPSDSKKHKSKKSLREGSRQGKDVVVHEFDKTTKHASFLRDNQTSSANNLTSHYEEGKGWVAEDGEIKEKESSKKRHHKKPSVIEKENSEKIAVSLSKESEEQKGSRGKEKLSKKSKDASHDNSTPQNKESEAPRKPPLKKSKVLSIDEILSSDSSSEDEEPRTSTQRIPKKPKALLPDSTKTPSNDRASSSDSPSSSSSSSSSSRDEDTDASTKNTINKPSISDSEASFSSSESESEFESESESESKAPTPKKPSPLPPQDKKPLNPTSTNPALEALFKPPTSSPKPSLALTTTFSFFGADADANEPSTSPSAPVPLTQTRSIRSAAPPPDTATVVSKKHVFFGGARDGEDIYDIKEEENEDEDTEMNDAREKGGEGEGESEWATWFWENRGETNRAWKKRRREAAKEKRSRDNRGRSGVRGSG
ncbi:MAG: hypothetical protein M1834_000082 [Cirrosporium novae-zelandiae]|nr:MAG: hypothetical protein M1834_000082 [Cirrosporium novae-zelandiae]